MAVRLSGVRKVFQERGRDIVALDGVDLEVLRGSSVVIWGPNASGKSVCLRIISGLEQPTQGSVDVRIARPSVVPFVFQDYRKSLLPWLSARENLLFPLEIAGVSRPNARERLDLLLSRMDLRVDLSARVYRLSGGEAQRLCIARALLANPELLLFDESLANLDYTSRREMRHFVASTVASLVPSPTIISVAHDPSDAVYLGQEIVFFSPRPARVVARMTIDLPWPRPINVDADDRFVLLERAALATFVQRCVNP